MASSRHLLMADGMGGHAAGEVASAVAVHIFRTLDGTIDTLPGQIQACGTKARRALAAMSQADDALETLGTTLITMSLRANQYIIGHIGDSRAYLLRGGELIQLTRDHTHVQRLVDSGQLAPEAARSHPYRAMLLRSLDDHPHGPALDVFTVPAQPGDRVLLCSDGLSDYVPAATILAELAGGTPHSATERLIDAALGHFTRDNVTVIVADVLNPEEETIPTTRSELWVPRFAGAVFDGVSLSPEAQGGLRSVLPAVEFDDAAAADTTEPILHAPALSAESPESTPPSAPTPGTVPESGAAPPGQVGPLPPESGSPPEPTAPSPESPSPESPSSISPAEAPNSLAPDSPVPNLLGTPTTHPVPTDQGGKALVWLVAGITAAVVSAIVVIAQSMS